MQSFSLMRRCKGLPAAVLATGLLWTGPAAALAANETVRLVPHRAVYEMSLGDVRTSSGMTGMSGRMVYEFSGSPCEGYTLNMRLVTQLSDRTGQATLTDLRSSTWEQSSGTRFRFNSSQILDEKNTEVTSGEAVREPDGKVMLKLRKPERSERELPRGLLFPTQHSFAILKAAAEGRRLLQATVFDGSEKAEKIYDTTAFIGHKDKPGRQGAETKFKNDEALDKLPSWPITISYFDQSAQGDTTPAYELSFRLFANGVSRDLTIDYGDFVLRGVLRSLEFLEAAPCR